MDERMIMPQIRKAAILIGGPCLHVFRAEHGYDLERAGLRLKPKQGSKFVRVTLELVKRNGGRK